MATRSWTAPMQISRLWTKRNWKEECFGTENEVFRQARCTKRTAQRLVVAATEVQNEGRREERNASEVDWYIAFFLFGRAFGTNDRWIVWGVSASFGINNNISRQRGRGRRVCFTSCVNKNGGTMHQLTLRLSRTSALSPSVYLNLRPK